MARPSLLQRVFAHLCDERPYDSRSDLLILADYFVKSHRHPEILRLDGGYRRPPFSAMPVDEAIQDGGWKVLEFERRAGLFRE